MDLSLTVLGCATPYPSADNPCSGYLVSHDDTRVWMDAGTGTLGPLQRHTRLADLDAIWISHLHADHSADLLTAYYALLVTDVSRPPVPQQGPPGPPFARPGALERSGAQPEQSAFPVTGLRHGHGGGQPAALEGHPPRFATRASERSA